MGDDILHDRKAAHISHHDISNDYIKRLLNKALDSLLPILSCYNVIPFVCQQDLQVIQKVLLIFH